MGTSRRWLWICVGKYAFASEGMGKWAQRMGELDNTTNSKKIEIGVQAVSSATRMASIKQKVKIGTSMIPDYYFCVERMPSDEKASVNQYKGYYIGRYEAGFANVTEENMGDYGEFMQGLTQETAVQEIENNMGKPVSQKEKIPYVQMTKEQAKGLAERLYTKSSNHVTSKLCSSYAWDTALKYIETKYPGWATTSEGENCGSNQLEKTGYHSVNNIYDIGGNVSEWTTEISRYGENSGNVGRGGDVNDTALECPADIGGYAPTGISGEVVGFRVTLYL